MGAVTFSIDPRLVACLKQVLPLSVFVETGTFKGDSVAAVLPYVERAISVEFSQPLWEQAAERFRDLPNVEVHLGDSAQVLARLGDALREESVLFWLDAHWCVAEDTGGEHSQCPLLHEMAAIGHLGANSVLMVDDARLFLAAPPAPHDVTHWPSFHEIERALRRLSKRHEIAVVNDVIVFHPSVATQAVKSFARAHGVDWLHAIQALGEATNLRAAVEEKEAVIQAQHASLRAEQDAHARLAQSLHEKEAALQALHSAAAEAQQRIAEMERTLAVQEAVLGALRSEHLPLAERLTERENTIRELRQALEDKSGHSQAAQAAATGIARAELMKELEAKESVIRELNRALNGYRATFAMFGFAIRPATRFLAFAGRPIRVFTPRLGVLDQHPPRELRAPRAPRARVRGQQLPKISIVTPSFRQGAYIERTIRSVLAQGYDPLEYFVQDGGSEDDTRAILERYSDRLSGWESRPDSGQSQAINRGFERTSGEIMAWLNSDDILLPGALATVADYLERHPAVDVVYGHRILIDEHDREIGRWTLPTHSDAVLSWADFVPQETLFWRRRIWDKVGGRVDESFRFAMDWDLLVRFREAGARFARIPRFLGGFRVHAQQKTSAGISDIGFQEMDRIRERVLGRVPSGMEVRRAVAPYMLRHVALDLGWRIRDKLGLSS